MSLFTTLLHFTCLLVISVKAGQPEKGTIGHLQSKFPVSFHKLGSNGMKSAPNGCSCAKKTCSCCAHISFLEIDKEACVNVSYVSADLGLRLQLILDGKVIYSGEVSVRNPPPICIGIPYLKKYAKLCLDLYNITWKKHIGGCAKIGVKVVFVIKKYFDLGCFNFDDLDDESKQVASRILYDLSKYQLMADAMKHQRQNKKALIL